MRRLVASLLATASALAMTACDDAFGLDDCDETEARTRTVSTTGARRLVVFSPGGELRLLGRPGVREVQLRGTACTEQESELAGVQLHVDRSGDVIYVDVELPSDAAARLDLTIDLPDDMIVDVEHERGDFEARRIGPLLLRHGSGDVYIDDAAGDVDVFDESGHVEIRRVLGDVYLDDGAGDVVIENIAGFVEVDEKRSGDLSLRGVTRSVLVRQDGSGDITADDIGGDLTVVRDTGGRVRHSGVRGRVSLP